MTIHNTFIYTGFVRCYSIFHSNLEMSSSKVIYMGNVLHSIPIKRYLTTSSLLCVKRTKPKISVSDKNFKQIPIKGTFEYKLRQIKDPYVKKRREEGYRCRSAYKLKQINEKHKLISKGMSVLDLGCAPGSWCQVLAELVYPDSKYDKFVGEGRIVGVDLIKPSPINGITFVHGDFTNVEIQKRIVQAFMEDKCFKKVDVVVSDAAPNASGIKAQDAVKLSNMIFGSSKLALNILKQDGSFLFKIWDGPETVAWKKRLAPYFKSVITMKPPSSRADSTETYIICKKYQEQTRSPREGT